MSIKALMFFMACDYCLKSSSVVMIITKMIEEKKVNQLYQLGVVIAYSSSSSFPSSFFRIARISSVASLSCLRFKAEAFIPAAMFALISSVSSYWISSLWVFVASYFSSGKSKAASSLSSMNSSGTSV